jgi:hypothetical protein
MVFGGAVADSPLNTCEAYSLAENTWKLLEIQLPAPAKHMTAAYVEPTVFLTGFELPSLLACRVNESFGIDFFSQIALLPQDS